MYQIDKIQYLQIGVQGENNATNIVIDMTSWVDQFPGAVFHVLFKPYNASEVSPQVSVYDSEAKTLTWEVGAGATAVVGIGYTEIRAQDGAGLIKKTRIIPTSVENSVSGVSVNPPASYEEWVESVLNAGSDAEAYAIGKRNGADVESTDPAYHNNSLYYKNVLQNSIDAIANLQTHKVSKPLISGVPTDGTNGQLLRTKGDGTTEWTDYAAPTDEQVSESISAWLDDHPEATTTVQDGAITPAKLSSVVRKGYVRGFETVSDMQAATDLVAGMICHTNAFSAPDDGGGAYYTVSSTGTANGMDVIALENNLYAVLKVVNSINVCMFGADSSGTYDSSSNIDRAIEYALAEDIHTLIFPTGKFLAANALTLSASRWKYLTLEGMNTQIESTASVVMNIASSDEFFGTIRGIRFKGNNTNDCLNFTGTNVNWSINKCEFRNFYNSIVANSEMDEITISECYFISIYNVGVKTLSIANMFNIRDCHFRDMQTGTQAINLASSNACNISNSTFQSGKLYAGIVVNESKSLSISNIYAECVKAFVSGETRYSVVKLTNSLSATINGIFSGGCFAHVIDLVASSLKVSGFSFTASGGYITGLINGDADSYVLMDIAFGTISNTGALFSGDVRYNLLNPTLNNTDTFPAILSMYGSVSSSGSLTMDISSLEVGVFIVTAWTPSKGGLAIYSLLKNNNTYVLREITSERITLSLTGDAGTTLTLEHTYDGTQVYACSVARICGNVRDMSYKHNSL